jgi:hemolysin activation/secretion protein
MNLQHSFSLNAIALLLFTSLVTVAQAAPPLPTLPQATDSGLLMRETRKPPEIPKKESEANIENTEKQRPPMQRQSDLQVTVEYFSFSGNTQFNNAELQVLLTKYKGHPVSFDDLQAAADAISEYYRQAGYIVAHAYLPAQSIKHGIVEIVILEGHLDGTHLNGEAIEMIGETRINKSVLQRFLNTSKAGDLVTDADLSHLSLLINDIPGIESKAVLSPGSKTGTTTLGLKVKEAPLISGYASTDNYGLYSTGYYRFDGGINIVDPFGFGDQLSLRVQTTDTGKSVLGAADYNLPINGYGTRFGVNFSELHYSLGRSFTPLNAYGIARTVGSSLTHPLYLSREARLTGIAHYEHRWLQDNIGYPDYPNPHNDREINVMSFSFAGSVYDKIIPAGALTQAYLNVSAGEVYFTNQTAAANDRLTELNSRGGYHKFNWQLNRTQNLFGEPWGDISLYANFNGQVGSKNLDSSEQISLGGPNAIRAFPVGEGSADEGWIFNGETRYGLPAIEPIPGRFQLIGFIDTGYSRINAIPLPGDRSRHLTGYGFGINWLGAAGFNLRTSLAWRDVKAQPLSDPNQQAPQAYFQLIKSF